MRKLVILRGPMGAGKSTWVRERGLEEYTLSSDKIRLLFQSPVLLSNGKYGICQDNDNKVWKLLFELLEERMSRGEFTVVDATHSKTSMISRYRELCKKYRYRATVVDFSKVPLDTLLKRNVEREEYHQVPKLAILNSFERMSTEAIPKWVNVVDFDDEEGLERELTYYAADFSHWKKIHHIGDIHGCYTALMEYLGGELKDDELYIFVGDYIDRGLENKEVVDFLIDIKNRKNVILLEGNHERWLQKWSNDEETSSRTFTNETAPQLEGLRKSDVRQLIRKLAQVAYYTYHGKTVLVNHGGLPRMPDSLMLTSTSQLIKGVGRYEDNIDESWHKWQEESGKECYQIHGHRNLWGLPVKAFPTSFNLEGGVEGGGHLRVVTLTEDGFQTHEIKNNVFKIRRNCVPMTKEDITVESLVEYFRNNDYVEEKVVDENISSFNFSREAFREKAWDTVTVRARGLFINTKTNDIVARSYDKFFNIGERQATRIGTLQNNLQFPVSVYKKENGYLGLLGYDAETNELFFSSKTTSEGNFAEWFKELFIEKYSSQLDDIKAYLKILNATMVFEVILPEKDPHIIEYAEDKIVLLDIIKREINFKSLSYPALCFAGNYFGLEVKEKICELNNWHDFYKWYDSVSNDFSIEHEGYVIQDREGFMVKLKLPYYNFWKGMRSVKDRVANNKAHLVKTGAMLSPLHNRFFYWLKEQPSEYLKENSIIRLRNDFYKAQEKGA